jgi:hypothetical protein
MKNSIAKPSFKYDPPVAASAAPGLSQLSDEDLLREFNELEQALEKCLADNDDKYNVLRNTMQIDNNNNERNLEIFQSTSEIISRNIIISSEEIQALISQIYANTTTIINTGDSLEYANKAKYKLSVAKQSMDIINSTNLLASIEALFDNMSFDHESIEYVVHVLTIVTHVLPNISSSFPSSNKNNFEILSECIEHQLKKIKENFCQAFETMDIDSMKYLSLSYKTIYGNILYALKQRKSTKRDIENSIHSHDNLLHVEFIRKSFDDLSRVAESFSTEESLNGGGKGSKRRLNKEKAKEHLKEMFKTAMSTYNAAMSTIAKVFDAIDEQATVQGILIYEIILNGNCGLLRSINSFIGIPIEMEMFEQNENNNYDEDYSSKNTNNNNSVHEQHGNADCYINENINLIDLLWVFSEIDRLFLTLPRKFNGSDTIFSTLDSLFLPFKKQFLIYEEKKIHILSKEILAQMYDKNMLASTDIIIQGHTKLHKQYVATYKNSLQLFLSMQVNQNNTGGSENINSDSCLPLTLQLLQDYMLPMHKGICDTITIACRNFDKDTSHNLNVEEIVRFYQSLIQIIEAHQIGSTRITKLLSNFRNINESGTDDENIGDEYFVEKIRRHNIRTNDLSSFARPFYEGKYVLISTIEKLVNKAIKNWLTDQLRHLKNIIDQEYKVTSFLGEQTPAFKRISSDFINTTYHAKKILDGSNLLRCIVNYIQGFFKIFYSHIILHKYTPEQGIQIKWDIQQLEKTLLNNVFTELMVRVDNATNNDTSDTSYTNIWKSTKDTNIVQTLKSVVGHFKRVIEILIVADYETAELVKTDLIKENHQKYESSAMYILNARQDAVL